MKKNYFFISYSSIDKNFANIVREKLNTNGIETWMAPFDIPTGSEYAKEISEAIKNCSGFILLFSENSQNSRWVKKEIERAINYGKKIYTFMLENFEINSTLEFYLSDCQIKSINTSNIDKCTTTIIETIKNDVLSKNANSSITEPTKNIPNDTRVIYYCPKCHAQLQENAKFCPHCMTQFDTKEKINAPKKKNKTLKIVLFTVIPIILIFAVIVSCVLIKISQPICTYDNFCKATVLVSQRMGIESYWDSDGFTNTHFFEEENIIQYSTKTNINNSYLSVFFYNEGEEISAYISDIPNNISDIGKAESILKCITQSACNYYFTDIDDVFDNESLYPKSTFDDNFLVDYTDLLKKTDSYNNDIKNGAKITTRYISMTTENDVIVVYYVTERENSNGTTLYDLAIKIYKK